MNPVLTDSFGRVVEYVRLSVTDHCDLRCRYCLPEDFRDFQDPQSWLTFDEIVRVLEAFAALGVKRVRLTGGEPLTRRGLPDLARRIATIPGIEDLSLSTNGIQLARHADALFHAGVRRLNVSLDTLQPERFAAITGGGRLSKVLDGLDAARAAGFSPIKLNTVVMRGVKEDEAEDLVRFSIARGLALRFIETMPVGEPGRAAARDFVDLQHLRQRLAANFDLQPAVMPGGGPARYVRVAGTDLRIGFITPMSQHFCETCNRVRLAADGTLYPCLGQDEKQDLRPLLRAGAVREDLVAAIRAALARKPERHEFREQPARIVRFMARTGG